MSRGKILFYFVLVIGLMLLGSPHFANAWPDDEGAYYVMTPENTPVIDGQIDGDEWFTEEEPYQETIEYSDPTFPVNTINIGLVMLANESHLFVKLTWESQVTDGNTPNSMGIAFSDEEPAQMADTYDRKVAYFNGNQTEIIDLYNCGTTEICFEELDNGTIITNDFWINPGVPDVSTDFTAQFGYDSTSSRAFYEFAIPLSPSNTTEDYTIKTGSYLEFVANPTENIAASVDAGHGGQATNPIVIQYEPRCQLFCRPDEGMDGTSIVFNAFFAILISMIFLAFIVSGHNENIAKRLWKVEITEEMAAKSVLMEMAYYNSSFLSLLTAVFFFMYAVIAFAYGFWAQWGVTGVIINGIPLVLGIIAIYDLIMRNTDPREMEERPGIDVQDSPTFWIVPALFLGLTLFMLVFIGIDVIS